MLLRKRFIPYESIMQKGGHAINHWFLAKYQEIC